MQEQEDFPPAATVPMNPSVGRLTDCPNIRADLSYTAPYDPGGWYVLLRDSRFGYPGVSEVGDLCLTWAWVSCILRNPALISPPGAGVFNIRWRRFQQTLPITRIKRNRSPITLDISSRLLNPLKDVVGFHPARPSFNNALIGADDELHQRARRDTTL